MLRNIYVIVLAGLVSLLAACAADDLRDGVAAGAGEAGDELPVEFAFVLPDAAATRGIENPKTAFTNGDVIHIQGTFKTEYEGVEGESVRYGAMMFDGTRWSALEGSMLTWPTTSVSGKFLAYFISGSTGLLYEAETTPPNRSTQVYYLSQIKPDGSNREEDLSDPLVAEAEVDTYGYAVELRFKHICAYLSLEDLEPQVALEYWFTRDDDTPLYNAFQLELTSDKELKFHFLSEELADGDDAGNKRVYISAAAQDVERDGRHITIANFFLAPGDYYSFLLRYPAGASGSYEYLKYDYDNVPANVGGGENTPPVLEGGRTYTLNVTKSPGIAITLPPEADGWDETDEDYTVDAEEFMKSVTNGTEYRNEDDVLILEQTAVGTRLLHNVDFQFDDYMRRLPFEPNVNLGQEFDGNYHYIKNLGCPLFRQNFGVIRNLGIKRIEATFISDEVKTEGDLDMSRHGGLCMWNRDNGTIDNVRIADGAEITALVKTDADQETHNVGCIIGSNTGKITHVEMSGVFNITVEAYVGDGITDEVDATVIIGGFAGQNAGTGSISDVSAIDGDLKINITNKCYGNQGAFYVGGIAGQCSAYLTDIILPDVRIDCRESRGVTSYVGGMVGEVSSDNNNGVSGSVTACIVSGALHAGAVNPWGVLLSVSYAGGLAGALQNVPVTDCRASVSVHGTVEPVSGVTYATGGAFGRIRTSTDVGNIIAYGSALDGLTGIDGYVGNFAGIVPQGENWEDNYKDKNIIVRRFIDTEDIGTDK